MPEEEILKDLKIRLDEKRYLHTISVACTASCLAMRYNADSKKAYLIGLIHDSAKCIPVDKRVETARNLGIPVSEIEKRNTELLHSKIGAVYADKLYNVNDPEIISAIKYHTTGKPGMTLLEKIVFVADYIEPGRNKAEGLNEIRRTAFEDIDKCVLRIAEDTLKYLSVKGQENIDRMTLLTYEYYRKLITEK